MAFLNQVQDEEQNLNLGAQTSGPPMMAGSGGVMPAAGGATGAAQAPKQQGSGNWTNLSTYLDANKGSGAALGGVVTDKAQTKLDSATGAVNAYTTASKGEADAGTKHINEGLISQINSNPMSVDRSAYDAAISGYKGPETAGKASGYAATKNTVDQAAAYRDNTGNQDQQRQALTETFLGRKPTNQYDAGNYSRGMSNLDSFLVNQDSDAQAKIKTFKDQNAGFTNKFSDATGLVNSYIANARKASDESATKTRDAVGDARKTTLRGVSDQFATRDAALRSKALAEAGQERERILREGGGQGILDQIGTTNDYLSGQANLGKVMTTEERARLQALANLDGSEGPEAASGDYTFNSAAFQNALKVQNEKNAAAQADPLANYGRADPSVSAGGQVPFDMNNLPPVEPGTVVSNGPGVPVPAGAPIETDNEAFGARQSAGRNTTKRTGPQDLYEAGELFETVADAPRKEFGERVVMPKVDELLRKVRFPGRFR